jgi:dihydrofolate reductase
MPRLRVENFTISIDGFGAGPDQDLDHPMGKGGENLHKWFFPTKTFQRMHGEGEDAGSTGIDNDFAERGFNGIGAWIMGRNMFGPIRGPWPDLEWQGWWGDNPPYHCPVFVLTHHERPPLEMAGGTTFYFTHDPIEDVLDRAYDAAGGRDVRLGGGVSAINQYVAAGLVDEMHIAISPVVLGSGERLFDGVDLKKLGYTCTESAPSDSAMHLILSR